MFDEDNTIPGYAGHSLMRAEERQAILDALAEGDRMCEIGSFEGASCRFWAERRPGSHFVCVEDFSIPSEEGAECSLLRWAENHRPNMSLFFGSSRRFLTVAIPRSFDLILVDGRHTYECCMEDLEVARALTRSRGLIVTHDYLESPESAVGNAVRDFCERRDLKILNLVLGACFVRVL